jgi:hypothetical protein
VREALRLHRLHLPPDHPDVIDTIVTLSDLLVFNEQFAEAKTMVEGILPAADRQAKDNPASPFQLRSILGQAELGLGNPRAAIPLLTAALPGLKTDAEIGRAKKALARARGR